MIILLCLCLVQGLNSIQGQMAPLALKTWKCATNSGKVCKFVNSSCIGVAEWNHMYIRVRKQIVI